MKPTQYYLILKLDGDMYDVYEQHVCQEKGCIMTDEAYIITIPCDAADKYISDYANMLSEHFGDELAGVEVQQ